MVKRTAGWDRRTELGHGFQPVLICPKFSFVASLLCHITASNFGSGIFFRIIYTPFSLPRWEFYLFSSKRERVILPFFSQFSNDTNTMVQCFSRIPDETLDSFAKRSSPTEMHSQKQDIESSLGFAQISIRSDKKNRASRNARRRKLLFQLWLNEGRSRISLHPLLYSFLVLASRINFESFPLKHRQKRSNRWRILASFPFVPRYDTSHLIERNVFPRFYR